MKTLVWMMVLMLLLSGCVNITEPVFETVEDEVIEPVSVDPAPISVWLPDDAAAQTMAEAGECYTWGECELRLQTLDSGDIRATLEKLTGLSAEKLTVMEYERDGVQIYQTVWSMTGEEGITLGRCMVADDGNYHYCVSLMSPEAVDVAGDYAQICASFDISGKDAVK